MTDMHLEDISTAIRFMTDERGKAMRPRPLISQAGVTLFELMVAVLLLALVSTMIYSVLNVGISFADKGESQILAMEQEQGFLDLLHRQVSSAWYDPRQKKIRIVAEDDTLKIFTRQPLLYRTTGLVLAIYRYEPGEQTVYYTEKRDYYNIDYTDDYMPDFEDMYYLLTTPNSVAWSHDEETGAVLLDYGERQYEFIPKCQKEE